MYCPPLLAFRFATVNSLVRTFPIGHQLAEISYNKYQKEKKSLTSVKARTVFKKGPKLMVFLNLRIKAPWGLLLL